MTFLNELPNITSDTPLRRLALAKEKDCLLNGQPNTSSDTPLDETTLAAILFSSERVIQYHFHYTRCIHFSFNGRPNTQHHD